MQRKILNAQHAKIPYMIILGDKEIENSRLSIRRRDGYQVSNVEISLLAERLVKEINERSLRLSDLSI